MGNLPSGDDCLMFYMSNGEIYVERFWDKTLKIIQTKSLGSGPKMENFQLNQHMIILLAMILVNPSAKHGKPRFPTKSKSSCGSWNKEQS